MDTSGNAPTYNESNPPTISGLSQRLSNGEPAQALVDDLVEYTIDNPTAEPLLMSRCISFLAGNGARVATEEPGCAFENLICKPARQRIGIVLDVASQLSKYPGELPFHLLARHLPLKSFVLMMDPSQYQASLRARDSKGRTVSHYLWDEQSSIVRSNKKLQDSGGDLDIKKRNSEAWLESVRMTWGMQEHLQKEGVGMELPDAQGRTAMDLCIDRLYAGDAALILDMEVCDQVKALIVQRELLANTDQVEPLPARSGPRL